MKLVTEEMIQQALDNGLATVYHEGLEGYGVIGTGCLIAGFAFYFMDEDETVKEEDYARRIADTINAMIEEEDEDNDPGEGHLYELYLKERL